MSEELLACVSALDLVKRRIVAGYPLHGALLSLATFRPCERTETMSVAEEGWRLVIRYSPAFVLEFSHQLAGCVLHELGHVLFGHTLVDPQIVDDPLLISMEVTVNEFIREELPGSPLLLAHYPFLPPLEDTFTRAERLGGHFLPQQHPRCGHGRSHKPHSDDALRGLRVGNLVKIAHNEAAGATEDLSEAVRKAWGERGLGRSEEVFGQVPPRVCWRQVLRAHLSSLLARSATYQRPSRRFPELIGRVPGRIQRAMRRRVMAVVDTSASMSPGELAVIAAELRVLRHHAEVYLVFCDTEIRWHGAFTGSMITVVGRGGTDLRPPLERSFLAQVGEIDVVTYFTDGHGPVGSCPKVPVIWCLSQWGTRPAPWGTAVWLTDT